MPEIDLIGSHGQTVHHLPVCAALFGKSIRATLQIGSPVVIAKLTGVVTVGDFRTGDVAVGGTGAPLVPYFDYLLLRSKAKSRGVLNIGGIANITILPKGCSPGEVVAFDTGPGNMVIDGLMKKFYGKSCDKNGATAARGRLLPHLLHWMLQHPYFKSTPPKSTGRELFGETFIGGILRQGRGARKQDIIATVTEFTALSVYWHYAKYIRGRTRIHELFVSGGGVLPVGVAPAPETQVGSIGGAVLAGGSGAALAQPLDRERAALDHAAQPEQRAGRVGQLRLDGVVQLRPGLLCAQAVALHHAVERQAAGRAGEALLHPRSRRPGWMDPGRPPSSADLRGS